MSQTTSKTPSRIPISSSTWFITGIGRGLGRNIAEEVMQRGGRVAGTVRSLAHADELNKQFPDQLWIGELDLSDLANIANTFGAAVHHFGRLHAVVSNAGYSLRKKLQLDAIRHTIDTNLIGSIELERATVAHMRPLGGGRLVQVSSGARQAAFPGLSLYCATNRASRNPR
jgi:NAD(P)-dependent dehydrogenase (short-subunit alcohol dehydrogenase family)